MDKTIVELFAGVGGFRLAFEGASKGWKTVFASQWEPGKQSQHAFDCYKAHFGDKGGVSEYSNMDISDVTSNNIPNHTILVGGFPCQDYSVAGTKSKGIEGKKGVLWWEIRRILEDKRPPFVLLENVDRLIKSPVSQRGRDFGVMLSCLNELGYAVEWRVVNAEEYGFQQRRRRVFIFASHKTTKHYSQIVKEQYSSKVGFFNKIFPIEEYDSNKVKTIKLDKDILKVSDNFKFLFENSGYMLNGDIFTIKSTSVKIKNKSTLSSVLQEEVSKDFFITGDVYERFVYMKGAKKEERTSASGFKYFYAEGPIPFPDILDRPARTILTSEGSNNRSTHIVKDKKTEKLRKLTPVECERINGFPDNWTNTGMPQNFRYFCMGNALVVDLVKVMAKEITKIVNEEK